MANCIAIVSDLIFASRITGTAAKLGVECRTVLDEATLTDVLKGDARPDVVFVDLHCDGVGGPAAIQAIKNKQPTTTVVAFGSHVEVELLQRARDAGADEVLPRSAFVQRLPEFLAGASGPRSD
jgi:DNA-binding NarL/FixJ family response regulator